ncbi:beta-lactamase family protein [Qipengyuania sp. GH1]|uniref:serine hydrolase domain-containing protein n=1 Tax=Qipengyuania aestuarii TaxID=2867241 RepID=UPI001C87214C|nr:serine hydrolase domain-containing protein [Qipengyuania aestuarii]MBX7536147.1 beta-lactamase family protein [Qipengyuania aestuarii]
MDLSGAVLLARGDQIEFAESYGLADRASGRRNTVDTKFNLASVSKMFTAICIMQLVEAGALSLGDTIARHLPGYPNYAAAKNVTIAHLLMHRSGIGNYWQGMADLKGPYPENHSDYLPLFAHIPLEHEPGSAFSYSNGGYIVLGLVIEAVTGRSYYDHVRHAVFERAGMADTDNWRVDEEVSNRAIAYMRSEEKPGEWIDCSSRLEARGSAAGSAYSTVGDLHRFALALTRNRLLGSEMTKAFLQGRSDTPLGKYGYGIVEQDLNGTRLLGHSGGHYGVAGELMIFPDTDTIFVVLTNGDVDGYWATEALVHEMIAGPTDDTRNYRFTQQLIDVTVSKGIEAGISASRRSDGSRKAREGVVDLAGFKYIHRSRNSAGIDLLKLNRVLHPESDYAVYRLADGLRVTGQTRAALDMYHAYLERVPGDAEAEAHIDILSRE